MLLNNYQCFRERIYLHIASELDTKFDALQEVKVRTCLGVEVLGTILEDEMADFVWFGKLA